MALTLQDLKRFRPTVTGKRPPARGPQRVARPWEDFDTVVEQRQETALHPTPIANADAERQATPTPPLSDAPDREPVLEPMPVFETSPVPGTPGTPGTMVEPTPALEPVSKPVRKRAPHDASTAAARLVRQHATDDAPTPADSAWPAALHSDARPADNSPSRAKSHRPSQQERLVLRFLLAQQLQTGAGFTPRLTKESVAAGSGIPAANMRVVLWRLAQKGCLVRDRSPGGRGKGSVYSIPVAVQHLLLGDETDTSMRTATSAESMPTVAKSNAPDLAPVASHEKTVAERLSAAVAQFGLDQYGVGANDVLELLRRQSVKGGPVFKSEAELLQSLEHIAFYLASDDARGIRTPKAWLISQLRRGYYAAPASFSSWEEQQEIKRLEDARSRLRQFHDIRRARVKIDFELWRDGLAAAQRERFLGGVDPRSVAAEHVLLSAFLEEHGITLPEDPSLP